MIETHVRKNKITLSDYDYERDIEHRLFMAHFTLLDVEILQEILFSPLKISLKKFLTTVSGEESETIATLQKFSEVGLLSIDRDDIIVNKDMRKYFESQAVKFEEDFVPNMEFLQSLLRKVPIGILPLWYNIPRTSNNIFDSLIEKYLFTPQIFQRYLLELDFEDETLNKILEDVFHAPDFKIPSSVIIEKYDLTRRQFEEYSLLLEFHLVACLGYEKVGKYLKEFLTPFHEWKEYLTFVKNSLPSPIADPAKVKSRRSQDFAHISDLSALLQYMKKKPFAVKRQGQKIIDLDKTAVTALAAKMEEAAEKNENFSSYLCLLLEKLYRLKFIEIFDNQVNVLDSADNWLDMRMENRSMYLYRNDINHFLTKHSQGISASEKTVREAEKSIQRILSLGWVYLDDFLQSVMTPLGDDSSIALQRCGKNWRYSLPKYRAEELSFIKAIVTDWLSDLGIVNVGIHNDKVCFCVSPFGQSLFGK